MTIFRCKIASACHWIVDFGHFWGFWDRILSGVEAKNFISENFRSMLAANTPKKHLGLVPEGVGEHIFANLKMVKNDHFWTSKFF